MTINKKYKLNNIDERSVLDAAGNVVGLDKTTTTTISTDIDKNKITTKAETEQPHKPNLQV